MAKEIITPRGKVFINTKTMRAELEWDPQFADEQNRLYGLGSPLQQFIDSYVRDGSKPYLPFRTGMLDESSNLGTVIGEGYVRYIAPYSARLYYNAGYNFSKDANPLAGAFWFERWKSDNLTSFIADVQRFAGGR